MDKYHENEDENGELHGAWLFLKPVKLAKTARRWRKWVSVMEDRGTLLFGDLEADIIMYIQGGK